MPYIKSDDGRREALQAGDTARTAGELNYQLFHAIKYHSCKKPCAELKKELEVFVSQFLGSKPNYQKYNDMTGALCRCAIEVERRIPTSYLEVECLVEILESYNDEIAAYEDLKIEENGDV